MCDEPGDAFRYHGGSGAGGERSDGAMEGGKQLLDGRSLERRAPLYVDRSSRRRAVVDDCVAVGR